jgi:hypothetical protein
MNKKTGISPLNNESKLMIDEMFFSKTDWTNKAKSYSTKTVLKVAQTVLIDENTDRHSLAPDLHGSFEDANQAEIIVIKIDANQRPFSYAYYNNTGLRIFKPINVRCALR